MILEIPLSFEAIKNSCRVLLPEPLYNIGVYPGPPQKCDFNGEAVGCWWRINSCRSPNVLGQPSIVGCRSHYIPKDLLIRLWVYVSILPAVFGRVRSIIPYIYICPYLFGNSTWTEFPEFQSGVPSSLIAIIPSSFHGGFSHFSPRSKLFPQRRWTCCNSAQGQGNSWRRFCRDTPGWSGRDMRSCCRTNIPWERRWIEVPLESRNPGRNGEKWWASGFWGFSANFSDKAIGIDLEHRPETQTGWSTRPIFSNQNGFP